MSQQPPLSETQRRAIVEADLRKNRKLHQFLLQTQELLTKPNVPLAAFKASSRLLRPFDYDLVLEERGTLNYCSYPMCNNAVRSNNQYKFDLKEGTVTEQSQFKFCSAKCAEESAKFRATLNDEPLYMRQAFLEKFGMAPTSNRSKPPAAPTAEMQQLSVSERPSVQSSQPMKPSPSKSANSKSTAEASVPSNPSPAPVSRPLSEEELFAQMIAAKQSLGESTDHIEFGRRMGSSAAYSPGLPVPGGVPVAGEQSDLGNNEDVDADPSAAFQVSGDVLQAVAFEFSDSDDDSQFDDDDMTRDRVSLATPVINISLNTASPYAASAIPATSASSNTQQYIVPQPAKLPSSALKQHWSEHMSPFARCQSVMMNLVACNQALKDYIDGKNWTDLQATDDDSEVEPPHAPEPDSEYIDEHARMEMEEEEQALRAYEQARLSARSLYHSRRSAFLELIRPHLSWVCEQCGLSINSFGSEWNEFVSLFAFNQPTQSLNVDEGRMLAFALLKLLSQRSTTAHLKVNIDKERQLLEMMKFEAFHLACLVDAIHDE